MAKLVLKHENAELKEVTLTHGLTGIGRLPDNEIQVDNLAVSGHHAKIYWDVDHFVIEDNNSLNGTYLNGTRISRHALRDGDGILIGKHTLEFKDTGEDMQGPGTAAAQTAVPKLDNTVMLDTKKMKEMLAAEGAQPGSNDRTIAAPAAGSVTSTAMYEPPKPRPPEKVGVLSVLKGKTDQSQYLLTGKMCVIGKSDMASIKLRGWFAPKMAAIISKRENGYVIAASEKATKVMVNGQEISGQRALGEGDIIEVAKIKMTFGFQG
jgi:pSer/pThr/pTyr-binding forkhead associated (FHA) protein